MRYDTIVIGAGHNGLTLAALVAGAKQRVLLLERQDHVGGLAAGREFHPGYRDTGLFHDTTGVRPAVVRELALEKHGLKLRRKFANVYLPGRSRGLVLERDPALARHEIARHSERDARRYGEFRTFLDALRPVLARFSEAAPPDILDLGVHDMVGLASAGLAVRRLGGETMMELLRMAPMSVGDLLSEWFDTGLLRAALAGPAIRGSWLGPWSAGTGANLLLGEASVSPGVVGGPAALVSALLKAATSAGVTVRTGARVEEIQVAKGRATGVRLASGEVLAADTICATCDPRQTFLELVPPRQLPVEVCDEVRVLRARGTTAKVDLALSGPLLFDDREDVAFEHVAIGESLDDLERAFDAVKYGELPARPHLEIHVPTIGDKSLAPDGHHVASVLMHFAPYGLKGGWTDAAKKRAADLVIDRIGEYSGGFASKVVAAHVTSPVDLERDMGLSGGQVHHGEHALDQLLFMRPGPSVSGYMTPIDGLVLGGSGSHPGGGITCAPGWLAAHTLLDSR